MPEVSEALIKCYPEAICGPAKQLGWKDIADLFQSRWNYPNCNGAMDGKQVAIQNQLGLARSF